MENLLREYMERAFAERGIERSSVPGPVVTISREFGCPSKLIAQHLASELNKIDGFGHHKKWRFINKEVVEATAKHLELNRIDVNYLFSSGGKGLVEDVLASFSPTYVSDHRIRKTITTVVNTIANQGHVVIVGRGGVGILRDRPNSLHIRLMAARDWRVRAISTSRNLGSQEATRLVDEMDKKRMAFIEMISGGKFNPYLFNIAFNCGILSIDEIVGTILGLMRTKKMI
jgi:cytidylate kinase